MRVANELVRSEAFEGFEPSPEVVGADEISEMSTQLIMAVVTGAFDGRLLDRAVHAFDLAIRPGVFELGETMVDLILAADPDENVFRGVNVPLVVGKLDSIFWSARCGSGTARQCSSCAETRRQPFSRPLDATR